MALLKAIIRSFKITKYRWMSVELKDGSILTGVVTAKTWEDFKKSL